MSIVNTIQNLFDNLISRFAEPGAPTPYIVLLLVAALLLAALLSKGRSTPRAAAEAGRDRVDSILGRIEKMDMTLNNFKTETTRSLELFRGEIGFVKEEIADLRRALEVEPRATFSRPSTPTLASSVGIEFSEGLVAESVPERWDISVENTTQKSEAEPELVATPEAVVETSAAEPEVKKKESRLTGRLSKTREGFFSKLKGLFTGRPKLDPGMIDELEALLVGSDLGIKTAQGLIARVKQEVETGGEVDEVSIRALCKSKLLEILEDGVSLNPAILPAKQDGAPLVVLMVGVNGVGKTTTTAKLASQWKAAGAKVLMVAADTFRAAAVEQLVEWGERIGVPVVKGAPEAKPASVVFDAMVRAKDDDVDVVIIDTAGRLHTKSNLMQELEGVRNIIQRHQPSAPHETILVVDGSTGMNAVSQAKEFNEAVKLTGLVVTKLDGTPKGGVVVAIKSELGIPVKYIGVGEAPEDLRPFEPREFVEALFDEGELVQSAGGEQISAHGRTRRKRREEGSASVS